MKPLSIAWVNLIRLFRDRSNIFFVLILPLGIILLIGSIFGGGFDPRVGLVVEADSPRAAALEEAIGDLEGIDVRTYANADELLTAVERGDAAAGVVIPAAFESDLAAGEDVIVGYISRADGSGLELRSMVEAAVAGESEIIRAARFAATQGAALGDAEISAESLGPQIPNIAVETEAVGEALFPDTLGTFDLGASTQLVLFMFLTGLVGASALIQTRNYGVSRRMLSTSTSPSSIVFGEALGRFGVVIFQGLYIIVVTIVVFGVNWGDPIGAAAIVVLFGATAAGAAMLVGSIASNDQQAGGLGVVVGIGIAALGGSMLPIELYSDSMRAVAHITPHAWALDGFAELVRREGTAVDILAELAVLAGFAAALIALASWRFRASLLKP